MALYGLLFFILRSEDSALMVGSLVVFAMLAGFMMLTRNVNWYALSQSEKKANTQPNNIYL
jgi:inner membrane protein